MDDYISREAAIREFERYGAEDDAIAVLNSIPAADVRPVVTCAECVHRHDWKRQSCQGRRPDFFCADGEKREES